MNIFKGTHKTQTHHNSHQQALGTTKNNRRLLTVLAVLSVIAGFMASTQYVVHQLNYHHSLGFNVWGVYPFWDVVIFKVKYHSLFPDIFRKAQSLGLFVTVCSLFGVAITKFMLLNTAKANTTLHGSATWATKKDITNAGLQLISPTAKDEEKIGNGVYIGGFTDHKGEFNYLYHTGSEHILTYAPTRSGKGVGLVVPTLLSWKHSTVNIDIKGELWALTAGWRQKQAHNKVLRFEPANSVNCAKWNPLAEIRIGTDYEVGDVQNIAMLIVDPDGKGFTGENAHWSRTAFSLFVGVILHLKYQELHGELFDLDGNPCQATMQTVDNFLADPTKDQQQKESWREMINYPHLRPTTDKSTWRTHPTVANTGKDMLDRPNKEAESVLSTTKGFLSLYRDIVVGRNTSSCDFRIKDLMHHDQPVSLYIILQPNDKSRLRPLIRILISMIVRLLADKMDFENGRPKAHYKHKLLMMLDEFPSLGKLEIMQESLAFVAGYGIKCYVITQDISQLKSEHIGYGRDESITANCHIQNAYAPNTPDTAKYLSDLSGVTTIVKEQITTSGKRAAAMHSQVSRTLQETQRPLLTTDEARKLKAPLKQGDKIIAPGEMLIFVAGYPAIKGRQMLYFQDDFFQKAATIPTPNKSDIMRVKKKKLMIILHTIKSIFNKRRFYGNN